MNTPNNTPQMPQIGDPQFDQKARVYEAWQRERNIAATQALRDAQQRAAAAAEALSTFSAPDPRRAEVLLLVSTMTSAQRAKPAQAVATALAMLQAVDAAGL